MAAADVNGDGHSDIIVGAGSGSSQIKVFSGYNNSVLESFFAFDPTFSGGVYVATGDVNADGVRDIIVGAWSGGAPQVKVFNGKDASLLKNFFAFSQSFTGGVRVAAGDFNGDGLVDITVASGPGGGPHVVVFSGDAQNTILKSYFPFSSSFTGGVFVGMGDLDGNGRAAIVAGTGAGINNLVTVTRNK